jgi:hypothetical protein
MKDRTDEKRLMWCGHVRGTEHRCLSLRALEWGPVGGGGADSDRSGMKI